MREAAVPQVDIEMDAISGSGARGKSRSRTRPGGSRDYFIGICLLLGVVVLWTASNFVTQDLFEDGYEKPFLVTYLNTSAFSLYLLPFAIRRAVKRYRQGKTARDHILRSEYEPLVTEADAAETLATTAPELYLPERSTAPENLPPLTTQETAQLAAFFCVLWFIANWSLNAALDYTSVASATILSSMSGFFTLGIGRIFRVEALTIVKFVAVLTSFGGVVLVSLSDSSQMPPSPTTPPERSLSTFASAAAFGDILALLSALFYSLYVIFLKVRIRSESRIDMQLFFGFVGLFNILTCWPIGVVLHFTGVETFELPHTSRAITALLVNMGITWSSDYIYVLAMLKTTPLVVTVGLSLTMPLAVVGDFILAKPAKVQVIIGAAIVLLSFVMVGLEDSREEAREVSGVGPTLDEEGAEAGVRLEEDPIADPSTG